jgi:hypothetical protein
LKQGGSNVVVYHLTTGDVVVVPNPQNVTSVGPPAAAAGAGSNPGNSAGANAVTAARVVIANAQANTISAVGYINNRQVGILVIRIP